jgi:NAD(P)-dependent dehydrogenase (short-subunit alcohol dehydrogenase family)
MSTRIVIITGGFGNLGRTVAATFAAAGDKVVRVDFAKTPPDALATLDIGGVDLADPAAAGGGG